MTTTKAGRYIGDLIPGETYSNGEDRGGLRLTILSIDERVTDFRPIYFERVGLGWTVNNEPDQRCSENQFRSFAREIVKAEAAS